MAPSPRAKRPLAFHPATPEERWVAAREFTAEELEDVEVFVDLAADPPAEPGPWSGFERALGLDEDLQPGDACSG